ncbi:MAG: hypothetical protein KIT02_10240 [Devosia sp.]|uniref:hypothetical protein n=1 Tax=Devosia sp. TaxID=1871048 RepID=UPI0024C99BDE|nr:hypothetical protein [Devosia sp.]UYN98345.1 MAG: hypothetical protein KIT02_10240 [Devosia sp.]
MRLLKQAAIFAALFLGLPSLIVALAPVSAFAQDGTTVSLPWGDWLGDILTLLGTVLATAIGALLTWALSFVPATLRAYITDQMIKQVEQLLARAIGHGVNVAAGALEGKELTFDLRHQILADALRYAVEHGPAKLIAWMGGEAGIIEKIEARLPWRITAQDLTDPLARNAILKPGAA